MPRLKIFNAASGLWEFAGGGDTEPFVGPEPPLSVTDGKLWWDTDDNSQVFSNVNPAVLAADPAFTEKYAPLEIGVVAHTAILSDHTGIAAGPTDITGFTHTINTFANRLYRVSAGFTMYPSAASTGHAVNLFINGVDYGRMGLSETSSAGQIRTYIHSGQVVNPGDLTNAVFKLTCTRFTGSGTVAIQCSTKAFFMIEDIGAI